MFGWLTNPVSRVIGGVLGGLGGMRQESAGRSASARQMAFQESMRGTQYQTAVADMRAAGINPMLAVHQGGAGTPSGSTYQPQNIGAAAQAGITQGSQADLAGASALETKQNVAALKKLGSSRDLVKRTLPQRFGSRLEKLLDPWIEKIEKFINSRSQADRAANAIEKIGKIPPNIAKKMSLNEFELMSKKILDAAEEAMEANAAGIHSAREGAREFHVTIPNPKYQ